MWRLTYPARKCVLLMSAVVALTAVGWTSAAPAQAAQDYCLAGTWSHSGTVVNALNGEDMSGLVTPSFGSPTGGAANLAVDITTELGFRHYVGAALEPYTVASASTPLLPAGSLDWTAPTAIETTSLITIPAEPASGAYSCSAPELSIAVPVAFGGPLTFLRSSPAPAGVTVGLSGEGSGAVTSGSTIDCTGPGEPECSAWVPAGATTLTATPNPGSAFVRWEGPCSGSANVCVLSAPAGAQESPIAVFEPLRTLTVGKAGVGDGEVSSVPAGISCPTGSACSSAQFAQGTNVTLTASPVGGSKFQGWTGACAGQTCDLTMDQDASVTAIFQPEDLGHTLSVSKDGKGGGTVESQPAGVQCGSFCDVWFLRGTPVILSAAANSGSSFGGWSGSCSGTGACFVVMDEDESVTASFTATPDETALVHMLSGVAASLAKLADQLVLPFHASQPGVLTIALYGAPTGKRARVSRARAALIGIGHHRFARATTARVRIKLTAAGRTLVKHGKRLRLTAKGTFVAHGKLAAAETETFVLHHSTRELELDSGALKTLAPSCPGVPCEVVAGTTGFPESLAGGSELDRVSRPGLIVAWSIKLGLPAPEKISHFDGLAGGAPSAQLSLLRPTGRAHHYRLVATSPRVDLVPYLGQETRFTLTRPLSARPGDVAALSIPTWAPALAVGLGGNTTWRATRPVCNVRSETAQTMPGSVALYSCLYQTAALTYSAIEQPEG